MKKLREFIERRHGWGDIVIGIGFFLCAGWTVRLHLLDTVKMTDFRWGIIFMLCGSLTLNGLWHIYNAKERPPTRWTWWFW